MNGNISTRFTRASWLLVLLVSVLSQILHAVADDTGSVIDNGGLKQPGNVPSPNIRRAQTKRQAPSPPILPSIPLSPLPAPRLAPTAPIHRTHFIPPTSRSSNDEMVQTYANSSEALEEGMVIHQDRVNPNIIFVTPHDEHGRMTQEEPHKQHRDLEKRTAIRFMVMGDIPYSVNHRYCLNSQLRELDSSRQRWMFMVHVGDMKNGWTPSCDKDYYSDIAEMFTSSRNSQGYDPRDVFFLIGDNEWNDCNDPDEAFAHWMNHFGNGDKTDWINDGRNPYGFGTLSSDLRVRYQRQSDNGSRHYPSSATNFAFFYRKILFLGINQVGGGSVGDEHVRLKNNIRWIRSNMARFSERGLRTLVVFAHATMDGARQEYFGSPFQKLLRRDYPDLLVLYIHGDGHDFGVKRVDSKNQYLIDLECDGGEEADPIMVSITRDSSSSRDGITVDRRGGFYSGGCDPGNRDKTWSSDLW